MAERFRLIYLKSTELEKSTLDEPSSSHDPEGVSIRGLPSTEYNTPETFSSQAILEQAKTDLKHPDPKVKILAIQYICNIGCFFNRDNTFLLCKKKTAE